MAKPFDQWFQGPWRVVDRDVLSTRPKLRPGEIIAHRSGAIVLNCPACNAMQFAHSPLEGDRNSPTLGKPVHCGAGKCKACAVWFGVRSGTTFEAAKPNAAVAAIPDELKKAGVHESPSLEAAVKRAEQKLEG